jgi:hypothetical protein
MYIFWHAETIAIRILPTLLAAKISMLFIPYHFFPIKKPRNPGGASISVFL